nr:glucose 1-dehydrogenase [Ammoniphilus resinae]
MFNLSDKVAVITGASKGIGREISLLLADAGVDVVIIARNRTELEEVAAEIKEKGRRVLIIPLDITRTEDVELAVEQIIQYYGAIDILVNNAGINIPKPAVEVTESDWDRVMDLNLRSAFFVSQAVGRQMIKQKRGKIIHISSQMAFVGYYDRAAYCSSKGGLTQMMKALAIEWAPYQVNVNAIAPTFIETQMTKNMFEKEEFRRDVLSRIPMGRLAKPEDLFGAILFLASGTSDMVTGQTIVVDGGWTVW